MDTHVIGHKLNVHFDIPTAPKMYPRYVRNLTPVDFVFTGESLGDGIFEQAKSTKVHCYDAL